MSVALKEKEPRCKRLIVPEANAPKAAVEVGVEVHAVRWTRWNC